MESGQAPAMVKRSADHNAVEKRRELANEPFTFDESGSCIHMCMYFCMEKDSDGG